MLASIFEQPLRAFLKSIQPHAGGSEGEQGMTFLIVYRPHTSRRESLAPEIVALGEEKGNAGRTLISDPHFQHDDAPEIHL